jgi:hypothetical protein
MGTKRLQQQKQHIRLNLTLFIALAAIFVPVLPGTASAVIPDGDVASLYDAIDTANASGSPTTIELAENGTYVLTGSQILIDEEITIDGQGSTIDGNGLSRVFFVDNNGDLMLNDLTVTGGIGSGIRIEDGSVTLNDSSVNHNTAPFGGGIHSHEGTVIMHGSSTVAHNIATSDSGGIFNYEGRVELFDDSGVRHNMAVSGPGGGIRNRYGTVILHGSSAVSHNTADNAGGIYNDDGTVELHDYSRVSQNTADDTGGGIYIDLEGTVELYDFSRVSHNTADNAGGIYNDNGTVELYDFGRVSHNMAISGSGGGIYIYTGMVELFDDSTITHNSAGTDGGGIYNESGSLINAVAGDNVSHNNPNDIAP